MTNVRCLIDKHTPHSLLCFLFECIIYNLAAPYMHIVLTQMANGAAAVVARLPEMKMSDASLFSFRLRVSHHCLL